MSESTVHADVRRTARGAVTRVLAARQVDRAARRAIGRGLVVIGLRWSKIS